MIRPLAALALVAAAPLWAADRVAEGQTPQPAARAGDYPFQLFVPRGYGADRRQRWPLLIFLHGSGERGRDLELVRKNGPPKLLADHPGTPMLIVSPQLEADGAWDTVRLDRLLVDLRRRYRVDPSRIYLTGLSLGGMGAWRWAAAHEAGALTPLPHRVAAA